MTLRCLWCGKSFSNVHYYTRTRGRSAGKRVRYVREGQKYCSSACGGTGSVKPKVAA